MAKRRRASGEGSFYPVEERGVEIWKGAITLHRPDGSTFRRYVRGRTRREAMERAAQARRTHDADAKRAATPAVPTLREAVEAWRRDVQPTLRINTARTRASVLTRFPAELLDAPLDAGLAARLQAYYATMQSTGYKPSTIHAHHAAARAVLRLAVARGQLAQIPAGIVLPTVEPSHSATLTAAEARRLLATSAEARDPLLALWAILAGTGMRFAEALGLRWQDIDLDGPSPSLRIAGQLTSRNPPFRLVETKTPRSRRTVPLVEPLLSVLRQERAVERTPHPWGLVVYQPNGELLTQSGVRWHFDAALKRAGVPRVTPHGMRHTAATLLLEAGVSAKVVADLLGHSSVTITLSVYSHVTPTLAREGAEQLGKALRGEEE